MFSPLGKSGLSSIPHSSQMPCGVKRFLHPGKSKWVPKERGFNLQVILLLSCLLGFWFLVSPMTTFTSFLSSLPLALVLHTHYTHSPLKTTINLGLCFSKPPLHILPLSFDYKTSSRTFTQTSPPVFTRPSSPSPNLLDTTLTSKQSYIYMRTRTALHMCSQTTAKKHHTIHCAVQ